MATVFNRSDYELKQVEDYTDCAEAYIAKGVLDAHGIEAVVDNSIMATLYGGITALGGYKLMVRSKDLDRARAVLAGDEE